MSFLFPLSASEGNDSGFTLNPLANVTTTCLSVHSYPTQVVLSTPASCRPPAHKTALLYSCISKLPQGAFQVDNPSPRPAIFNLFHLVAQVNSCSTLDENRCPGHLRVGVCMVIRVYLLRGSNCTACHSRAKVTEVPLSPFTLIPAGSCSNHSLCSSKPQSHSHFQFPSNDIVHLRMGIYFG